MFIEILLYFLSIQTIAVLALETDGSYWQNSFFNTTGDWLYTCHGDEDETQPFMPDAVKQNPDICTDDKLNDLLLSCLPCQVYCEQARARNKCFNSANGALQLLDPVISARRRYCVFQLQFIKAKLDLRYVFPDKPKSKSDACNPSVHSCSYIQRDCLHYNKSHDDVLSCQKHPAYCAHESVVWLANFGKEGPDCARISLDNFHKYLYDIDPWSAPPGEEVKLEHVERWLICSCNHPFTRQLTSNDKLLTFPDCKRNIESLFDKITNMPEYDKCRLVNNFTDEEVPRKQTDSCIGLKETTANPKQHIIIAVLIILLLLFISVAIYLYMSRSRSVIYGNDRSQLTVTTAIDDTVERDPLLHSVICYDGSVETKAIPRILSRYLTDNPSLFDPKFDITTKNVLHGNPVIGKNLHTYIQCADEKLSFRQVIDILRDISWWINELHGETTTDGKNWSIFHGAMSPTNIWIVESDTRVYAMVVNYEFAQDISNHSGNVNVCKDEDKINIKFLPPEMIILPERNEARCVLSADVYGFACIAWKMLRSVAVGSYSNEDPFDRVITNANDKDKSIRSNTEVLKAIFEDTSIRPSFTGIDAHTYGKLLKIIEECWSDQPVLRLTGAQLFWRMNETFSENNNLHIT